MNLHLTFPKGPLADAAGHILGSSALADVVGCRGSVWGHKGSLHVKISADVYETLSPGQRHLWALLNSIAGYETSTTMRHLSNRDQFDEPSRRAVAAAMNALMGVAVAGVAA